MSKENVNSFTTKLNGDLPASNPECNTAVARDVVRCEHCTLVQFRTTSGMCRRCMECLPERVTPEWASAADREPQTPSARPVASASQELAPADRRGRDSIMRELAVGNRVRELRESKSLTQEQVAAKAGVPRTYISRIENAHLLPGTNMIHRLADAMGVSMLELIPLTDAGQEKQRRSSPSVEDVLWRSFSQYLRNLRDEQVSAIVWQARAMLCDRLRHQVPPRHSQFAPAGLAGAVGA
jgi:transcriptional regulator with XRE-family HTH domain